MAQHATTVPDPSVHTLPPPHIPAVPDPSVHTLPPPHVPAVPYPPVHTLPSPHVPAVPDPSVHTLPSPHVPAVPSPRAHSATSARPSSARAGSARPIGAHSATSARPSNARMAVPNPSVYTLPPPHVLAVPASQQSGSGTPSITKTVSEFNSVSSRPTSAHHVSNYKRRAAEISSRPASAHPSLASPAQPTDALEEALAHCREARALEPGILFEDEEATERDHQELDDAAVGKGDVLPAPQDALTRELEMIIQCDPSASRMQVAESFRNESDSIFLSKDLRQSRALSQAALRQAARLQQLGQDMKKLQFNKYRPPCAKVSNNDAIELMQAVLGGPEPT
ncbi:hypothetical protein CYMTET_17863 [Cymbomonas tetramitiformis]|uniref:Uncharacterized protein n=1 Tax=Cymbomonas tetramitiformis TaxID=36881 RepID=A0AAE0G9T7_9CHLO|nr:hypothetical protein CYMTET_17863 [Cymbomonas tetramitiformis]